MDLTHHRQLDRLADRTEKLQLFKAERRQRVKPLTHQRQRVLDHIDAEVSTYLAKTLPTSSDAMLAIYDRALHAVNAPMTLSAMRDHLRATSIEAAARCKRYEKDFNIHALGEKLPDLEKRLGQARTILLTARRAVEETALALRPVFDCNTKLAANNKPIIDAASLSGPYAKPASWLGHMMRLVSDKTYRAARRAIAQVERKSGPLAPLMQRYATQQTELMIHEQAHDLYAHDVETTRSWLSTYVDSWTARLSEPQVLAELRQYIADQMQIADFRAALDAQEATRLPDSLRQLYSDLDSADRRISQFYASFDLRHAAGRVESHDGEMTERKRTPSNISGDI